MLTELLRGKGATVTVNGPQDLSVAGLECRDVGVIAAAAGLTLYELVTRRASLEDAFMELTRDQGQYRAAQPATGTVTP